MAPSGTNESIIHLAAKQNNVAKMKLQLSLGANVDVKDYRGRTSLHLAARSNKKNSHYGTINFLLKNGADVNAQDRDNCTPLLYTLHKSEVKVVKLLLNNKADVNSTDGKKKIPLSKAIEYGKFEFVQLLLDHGSDIKNVDVSGCTPLHDVACWNSGNSHLKIAELLLKKGADVNAQDNDGKTPLHHLVENATYRIVQLFLNFKADANIKDNSGEIPIFTAICFNNTEVFELLLDANSDLNTVNTRDGSTLLHTAYKSGCSVGIVKSLLKKGMDANVLDHKGRTPLMVVDWLSLNQNPDLLMLLLKYADVNAVDFDGNDIISFSDEEFIWKTILEHVAKMQALDIALHPSVLESISKKKERQSYFEKCMKELAEAKNMKLQNCWVTFFNLLVDGRRKLKNYAGNQNLIQDLEKNNYRFKFPIYGALLEINMVKGIGVRKFYDDSAEILSDLVPIFDPTHLIIKDILDCLQTKDVLKLCENSTKK